MFARRSWERTFTDLFLDSGELPAWAPAQKMVIGDAAEEGDVAWDRCGGIRWGFNSWHRTGGGDFDRLVDIRSLFGTEEQARRYHRLRYPQRSEGLNPVGTASCGEGGLRFTGSMEGELPVEIQLFTVGPVAAKVFGIGVKPGQIDTVAVAAAERIRAGLSKQFPKPRPEPATGDPRRWPRGECEYEVKLRGQPLLAGEGVGSVLSLGDQVSDMYATIGGGDEEPHRPFSYYFVNGAFGFVVQGDFLRAKEGTPIAAMAYFDDPYGSLQTPEGLTIGSSEAEIVGALGPPDDAGDGWLSYSSGIRFFIDQGRTAIVELRPPTAA